MMGTSITIISNQTMILKGLGMYRDALQVSFHNEVKNDEVRFHKCCFNREIESSLMSESPFVGVSPIIFLSFLLRRFEGFGS